MAAGHGNEFRLASDESRKTKGRRDQETKRRRDERRSHGGRAGLARFLLGVEGLGEWLRERLDPCPGIVCTGAAVAFLAGTQAKIPVGADRSGLGWLMRCIYEPKKFIPRYWSALPLV